MTFAEDVRIVLFLLSEEINSVSLNGVQEGLVFP